MTRAQIFVTVAIMSFVDSACRCIAVLTICGPLWWMFSGNIEDKATAFFFGVVLAIICGALNSRAPDLREWMQKEPK